MIDSVKKRWGSAKSFAAEATRYLAYRAPIPRGAEVIKRYWEQQAPTIHEQWGSTQHDFTTLRNLLLIYRPHSVLDVGCGSGRLFGLYAELGITDVVGIDIAEEALAVARQHYPHIRTVQAQLQEISFPSKRFDLAICNRVLQHVPPRSIDDAIARLCQASKLIYLNELTETDGLPETTVMFMHKYDAFLSKQGFVVFESGRIDRQSYSLFGRFEERLAHTEKATEKGEASASTGEHS